MSTQDRLLDAYMDAVRRHPDFPTDVSAMGAILAEEGFEVVTAIMQAMQAINDHRDEGKALDHVRVELAHVNTVTRRMLERLE